MRFELQVRYKNLNLRIKCCTFAAFIVLQEKQNLKKLEKVLKTFCILIFEATQQTLHFPRN